MKTFDKYKKNLKAVGNKIYSYDTHVADIDFKTMIIHVLPKYKNHSATTSKHINYVDQLIGFKVIR